jgi:hypothetical protein
MSFLLALAATASLQPSFDCARARTQAERIVCHDDQLAAYDRAIAYSYKFMRRYPGYKTNQTKWLRRRNACSTVQCIRAAYDANIRNLVTFGLWDQPEVKTYKRLDGKSTLRVLGLGKHWYLFTVLGTESEPFAWGGTTGVIQLRKGRADWRRDHCVLGFTFRKERWTVEQPHLCKSDSMSVTGIYRRTLQSSSSS